MTVVAAARPAAVLNRPRVAAARGRPERATCSATRPIKGRASTRTAPAAATGSAEAATCGTQPATEARSVEDVLQTLHATTAHGAADEGLQAFVGDESQDWHAWLRLLTGAEVASLLWRFAKRGCQPSTALLDAAADSLEAAGPSSHAAGLQLLWALASLKGRPGARLLAPAIATMQNELRSTGSGAGSAGGHRTGRRRRRHLFTERALVSVFEALGRLRHRDPALLEALSTALVPQAPRMSARTALRLLQALAALEHRPRALLAAVAARLDGQAASDRGGGAALASLRPPQLSALAACIAALDWSPGAPALREYAAACLAAGASLTPAGTACVLWTLARRGSAAPQLLQGFAPVLAATASRYSMRELADMARAYAKAGVAPAGLFEAIAARAAACVDGAELQDVLRVVTAFDQLGLQPAELLGMVESWADRRLAALSPQALAAALASFARFDNRSPRLLATAASCAARCAPGLSPGELSQVVWAFARLDFHPGAPLLDAAAAALAADSAGAFGDRAAANLLWALAALRHRPSGATLDAIAAATLPRLPHFSAHSLSLIAWGFATLGHPPPPPFLEALGRSAARGVRAVDSQTLSLAAWGLATLGHRSDALLRAAAADCVQRARLRSFQPHHLGTLLWGMGKVGFDPGTEFLREAAAVVLSRLPHFAPSELHNVAWAHATLRRPNAPLLDAIAAEAAERSAEFSGQELSGVLWALARLREERGAGVHAVPNAVPRAVPAALVAAVGREVAARPGAFAPRDIASLLWAMGRLEVPAAAAAPAQEAVGGALQYMSGTDLAAALEGLACLGWRPGAEQRAEVAARFWALAPSLDAWELSSSAYHLTRVGMAATTRALLTAAPPSSPKLAAQLERVAAQAPPSACVHLLAAMAGAGVRPETLFRRLRRRLATTSPAYAFTRRHLALLHAAEQRLGEGGEGGLKLRKMLRQRMAGAAEGTGSRVSALEVER